jgi:ATP-binding cassette, subfamily B, multidrug efflux pump
MLVRWLAHRYLLGQSMQLLPGRVRRPHLAEGDADRARVRETVMKLMDVGVYVVVYFTGALFLIGRPTSG